jgi:hypothetical protein
MFQKTAFLTTFNFIQSILIVHFGKYKYNDQIKEGEMGIARSTHGLNGNPEGRDMETWR